MKRKIYDRLIKWKEERNGHTALLIEGARRVGKSYIVEEFAKNEYETYVLINFSHTTKAIKNLFIEESSNISLMLQKLSNQCRVRFIPRRTLIIFDEVQKCPAARECIKFLVEDGRFDYIETGSLISIHENIKDIVIPSEEEKIRMFPMDFEEFCWALGDEVSVPEIRRHFEDRTPFGDGLHKVYLDLFRQYMIVGGMPGVVKKYSETKDFTQAEEEKKLIISLYREDVGKRSKTNKRKTSALLEAIPSELGKHDKCFVISDIDEHAKRSKYEEPVYWLEDSMIVNTCYNSNEPGRALGMNMDSSSFKMYMGDTGLLVTLSIGGDEDLENDIYTALLQDRMHLNEGMFMENVVAQMLRCNGHDLYFYAFYPKMEDGSVSKNRNEVDFLIPSGRKVSPIEVKAGRSTSHASLDYVMKTYSKQIGPAYVVHQGDLRKDGNLLYIPIYAVICL